MKKDYPVNPRLTYRGAVRYLRTIPKNMDDGSFATYLATYFCGTLVGSPSDIGNVLADMIELAYEVKTGDADVD